MEVFSMWIKKSAGNLVVKRMFLNIILLLFLASCDKKEPIVVKQIISKEFVTIEDNYMDRHLIKDSVRMSIPLEFEININSTKVKYITWNYRVDNKILDKDYFDYEVFSKEDITKPIFQLDSDLLLNNKRIHIIIKEMNYLISRNEALKLLKKYGINKSIDDLKSKEVIELTAYDKFRKENIELINAFNKINDSINFKVMRSEEYFFYVDKKINR